MGANEKGWQTGLLAGTGIKGYVSRVLSLPPSREEERGPWERGWKFVPLLPLLSLPGHQM